MAGGGGGYDMFCCDVTQPKRDLGDYGWDLHGGCLVIHQPLTSLLSSKYWVESPCLMSVLNLGGGQRYEEVNFLGLICV